MSFKIIQDSVLMDHRINSDEKLVLTLLSNRLSLSRTKGNQFKKNGQYFVNYAQAELAEIIGKSRRTITTILAHLEQLGMIRREKRFNASDCIFLPISEKIAHMDTKKLRTNNTDNNNTDLNNTSNTINTKNSRNENHKETALRQPYSNLAIHHIINNDNALKNWETAVSGKLHLNQHVINAIKSVCNNDVTSCYKLTGLMNNAKKHIENKYNMTQSKKLKQFSRYESNVNLGDKLAERITYIASKLPSNPDEQAKYWTRSFINFFGWALGMTDHTTTMVNPAIGTGSYMEKLMFDNESRLAERNINRQLGVPDGPEIPMFKIQ